MKNDLFTIGSITIHGYGLMIGIGIIAAYYLAEYRANKRGMDVDMILSIAICGVVCGILGAKLLYYVTIFDEILANPKKLLDISDGFVVYGGIIGGVLGGYVLSRIKHISFFSMRIWSCRRLRSRRALDGSAVSWLAAATVCRPTAILRSCSTIRTLPRTTFPWFRPSSSQVVWIFCTACCFSMRRKSAKTGAGGITVSDLLQSGTLRAGIFPR